MSITRHSQSGRLVHVSQPHNTIRESQADPAAQVAKGNLHTLDFTRIKDASRTSARQLLTDSTTGLPNTLAQELSIPSTSTSGSVNPTSTSNSVSSKSIPGTGGGGKGRLMNPNEKKAIVEALMRASTTEEVRKLERMLAEGLVPEGDSVINGGSTETAV